jgi:hypothetical protein
VLGYQGAEYVVELHKGMIYVRPKGAKRGGPLDKRITPSALHDKLVAADNAPERRPQGRRVGQLR